MNIKLNNEQKEALLRDYKTGYSMGWIADRYSVTRQTVYIIAKDNGLKLRRATVNRICPICNLEYKTQAKNPQEYCTQACYIKHLKSLNVSYYQDLRLKGLSVRQWQRKAREVANNYMELNKSWVVHHMDGDLANLEPSNLFVFFSHSLHLKYHHRLRKSKLCKPTASDGFYVK